MSVGKSCFTIKGNKMGCTCSGNQKHFYKKTWNGKTTCRPRCQWKDTVNVNLKKTGCGRVQRGSAKDTLVCCCENCNEFSGSIKQGIQDNPSLRTDLELFTFSDMFLLTGNLSR